MVFPIATSTIATFWPLLQSDLMKAKTIVVVLLIAAAAYSIGASNAGGNRPILRLLGRIAGVWLLFREPPPAPQESRYVHATGGGIDHRNAL